MLKKFQPAPNRFKPGSPVYLVTRTGEILEGFHVAKTLMELVELDRPPIASSEKQGFSIKDDRIVPNWCEGRKRFRAGFASMEEAKKFLKIKQET